MELSADEQSFLDEAGDRILAHSRARREAGLYDKIHAVVRSASGEYYEGMSFEPAQPQFGFCAERHAILDMQYAETETTTIDTILTAGAVPVADHDVIMPCGACRHVIEEFGEDATVFCSSFVRTPDGFELFPRLERYTPAELFPEAKPLPTWE